LIALDIDRQGLKNTGSVWQVLELYVYRRVINNWSQIRRKPIAAEATSLAITNNFFGDKKSYLKFLRTKFLGLADAGSAENLEKVIVWNL